MRHSCWLARASIKVNEKEYSLKKNGHNIVAIQAATGLPYRKKSFATHANINAGKQMAEFINGLYKDTIVVIATQVCNLLYWFKTIPRLLGFFLCANVELCKKLISFSCQLVHICLQFSSNVLPILCRYVKASLHKLPIMFSSTSSPG